MDGTGRRLRVAALASCVLACGCGGSAVAAGSGGEKKPKAGGGPMVAASASAGFSSLSILAGQPGGAGDADGTGAAARFNAPDGLAYDGAGNLYVTDVYNGTIRKVALATGAVTTLQIDGADAEPWTDQRDGLAYDATGNLYVTNAIYNTISRIVLATGAVTTLAGSTEQWGDADGTGAAASFSSPQGLAYDGAGNLYVADAINCTLRKIVVATGAVTTFAGTAQQCGSADGTGAAASFAYPEGLAYDGAGNLYVADSGNSTIRKVVLATGAVTTIAGSPGQQGSVDGTGSAARFVVPAGLAYDGAGSLYVADADVTIRKVALATGAVTTLAGTPGQWGSADSTGAAASFNGAWGLAADGAGDLYVADQNNDTIRQVVVATAAVTTIAGAVGHGGSADGTGAAASFNRPWGLATDGAGNLYVGDTGNQSLRQIVVATGAVTTNAGNFGYLAPTGLAFDGAGNLFAADQLAISEVALSTAAVTTLAGAGTFYWPQAVAYDGVDTLYIADTENNAIRQIVPATGQLTTLAGRPGPYDPAEGTGDFGDADGIGTAASFYCPEGLAYDGAGNLYVADTDNGTIRKIMVATGEVTTFAGTAQQPGSADGSGAAASFRAPTALLYDGAGNLYVADTGNSTVRKIALATAQVTTVIGVAGDGIVVPGPIAQARLAAPAGLAMGANGTLFISDSEENVVLEAQ